MKLDPRDLDRRLVPAAAGALRRLLDAGASSRRRAVGRVRVGLGTTAAAVRRMDDRATETGPLRVLRDVPQLAVLAVTVVLLLGTGAALLLDEPDAPSAPSAGPVGGASTVVQLGVPPDTDVELYLAQTRAVLDDVARRVPDAPLLAVVHLSRYVAAAEVPGLLAGTSPLRFFLRASTAGPDAEVVSLPVQEQVAATVLPALCAATSVRKSEDARSFQALADSIEVTTPEEQLAQVDFAAEAVRAEAEAQAYAGDCATTFAAVVVAPAAVLRALLERDGVRGIEAAPGGAVLPDVDVQPLLPETTGTVPSGRER